jgi:hypothetical protein
LFSFATSFVGTLPPPPTQERPITHRFTSNPSSRVPEASWALFSLHLGSKTSEPSRSKPAHSLFPLGTCEAKQKASNFPIVATKPPRILPCLQCRADLPRRKQSEVYPIERHAASTTRPLFRTQRIRCALDPSVHDWSYRNLKSYKTRSTTRKFTVCCSCPTHEANCDPFSCVNPAGCHRTPQLESASSTLPATATTTVGRDWVENTRAQPATSPPCVAKAYLVVRLVALRSHHGTRDVQCPVCR